MGVGWYGQRWMKKQMEECLEQDGSLCIVDHLTIDSRRCWHNRDTGGTHAGLQREGGCVQCARIPPWDTKVHYPRIFLAKFRAFWCTFHQNRIRNKEVMEQNPEISHFVGHLDQISGSMLHTWIQWLSRFACQGSTFRGRAPPH